MKANSILVACVFGVFIVVNGCDNSTQPNKSETPKVETKNTNSPKTETPKTEPAKTEPVKAEPAKTEPVKTEPAKADSKVAGVGVGDKGRGIGQGFVATPAATLFAVRERLVFVVQIPQAMNLFKAEKGQGPKDHAEFMELIIKANNIHLPTLPEDQQYRYDPKTEQLMVEPK
jgi:hypothetical protein